MGRAKPRQVLKGRVALITGASSGIGWAMALGFADAGADLGAGGAPSPPPRAARPRHRGKGRRALLVVADVAIERAMKRVLQQADLVFPGIDILVNNAGICLPEQPTHETPLPDWERVLAVNLRGPFLLSRLLVPRMVAAGYGRIINLTSSYKAEPFYGVYSVSKAALFALTASWPRSCVARGFS